LLLLEGRRVKRDVVVDELPDERKPGEQATALVGVRARKSSLVSGSTIV